MFCSSCGKEMSEVARFCEICGTAVPGGTVVQSLAPPEPAYAGFWLRFLAYVLDSIVIFLMLLIVVVTVTVVFGFVIGAAGVGDKMTDKDWEAIGEALAYLIGIPAWFLYFSLMECSSWQATPGKKAFGLVVTDLGWKRISFGRALGRNVAKILSALILNIGFLMAGFTQKKQAFHDQISECLVIKRT